MADLKSAAGDDAALLLGPGCSVAVGGTGITEELGIWAAGQDFPAVTKLENICHHLLRARGKVILAVAIIVPTETTHLALRSRDPLVSDEDLCLLLSLHSHIWKASFPHFTGLLDLPESAG